MDRRAFVKTLAGLAGAAALPLRAAAQLRAKPDSLSAGALQVAPAAIQKPALAPAPTATSTSASTASGPAASTKAKAGYASGSLALMLDGAFAGQLASVDGGNARADVVSEPKGPDGAIHKHAATIHYTDFAVELMEAPSGETAKWVKAMLDGKSTGRSGAVASLDRDGKQALQREFQNALLTSFTVPVLDAADSSALHIGLTFAPETARFAPGDASKINAGAKASAKPMRSGNFRLSIKGLESACARVTKIEAITFKQKLSADEIGSARVATRQPAKLEVPNLEITVADSGAQAFYDWLEDFLIKGNNGQGAEKTGTLELLSANMKDVLMTLSFQGLGICEASPMKVTAGSDTPHRTRVAMYFERANLK